MKKEIDDMKDPVGYFLNMGDEEIDDMKDTVRYFLCMGDEEEAINVLTAHGLSKREAQSIIDEVDPMTIEEAFEYMNSV